MKVGKYTYGAQGIEVISFDGQADIEIGAFTSIAEGVRIFTADGRGHEPAAGSLFPFGLVHTQVFTNTLPVASVRSKGPIRIGNDCWIGNGVTIMSGVTIGDGAIVAANSHVVKNVDPYTMVGGNPAKACYWRYPFRLGARMQKLAWWDLPDHVINKLLPLLMSEATEETVTEMERIVRDEYH